MSLGLSRGVVSHLTLGVGIIELLKYWDRRHYCLEGLKNKTYLYNIQCNFLYKNKEGKQINEKKFFFSKI